MMIACEKESTTDSSLLDVLEEVIRVGKLFSETQILNVTSKLRSQIKGRQVDKNNFNPTPWDNGQVIRIMAPFNKMLQGSTEVFNTPTLFLKGSMKANASGWFNFYADSNMRAELSMIGLEILSQYPKQTQIIANENIL